MHLPLFWSVGAGQCHQKCVYWLVSSILWIYHEIHYKICSCLLLHPLARSHWGFPFAFTDEMPSRTNRTSTCRYRLSLIQNLYIMICFQLGTVKWMSMAPFEALIKLRRLSAVPRQESEACLCRCLPCLAYSNSWFFLAADMFHWVTQDGCCSRKQTMWASTWWQQKSIDFYRLLQNMLPHIYAAQFRVWVNLCRNVFRSCCFLLAMLQRCHASGRTFMNWPREQWPNSCLFGKGFLLLNWYSGRKHLVFHCIGVPDKHVEHKSFHNWSIKRKGNCLSRKCHDLWWSWDYCKHFVAQSNFGDVRQFLTRMGFLFVPYSHWVTIRVMYHKMLIRSDFNQILPPAHSRCPFQIRFLQTNLQKSSTMHLWKVCQKTLCCGGGRSMSWWPGICWWLLWWIEETYLNRLAGVGKGPITCFNMFCGCFKIRGTKTLHLQQRQLYE